MDTFSAITEERRRVANFLDGLEPHEWATESCCAGWTIQEVAAHLVVGPMMGVRGALPFMVRAFGRPNKANDLGARELSKLGPERLVTELRQHAESRFLPPGFPPESVLVDVIIHGQDMTRPLGRVLDVPTEHWAYALGSATARRYSIINARNKLKGLSFAATDSDYRHGDGPLIEGPSRDLAHAMLGRAAALDALDGPGVELLRSRL